MPRRTRSVPAEALCQIPHCECEALPPLCCGHKFCSACMVGLVKVTHPELAMLLDTCPLCRQRSAVEEITFALLMQEHKPKGTMLMDFTDTKAGLCLVIQPKDRRKDVVREPRFYFLKAVHYLKYIDGAPPEEQDMNRLFEELSRRSQTRNAAERLLVDTLPFYSPRFPLMADMFLYLATMLPAREEETASEQNV